MFKNTMQYAFELDGATYCLSGDTLEQVPDLKEQVGTKWLITDMSEAVSQFITVNAPINNAEFVVRQQLQESGEFEGPVTIITHFKKKKGSNSTDILFTAVPTNIYNSYKELAEDSDDVLLIFPIYLILLNVLQQAGPSKPAAVIFQHGRFADMIIGTKTKIYYANRSVAFTTEQEQLDQLWNSAIKDIEMAENDHRIEVEKIIPLNWIDSSEPPEWEANYKDRIVMPPREPVQLYEDSLEISFIKAVKKESATNSISDTTEKISYYALKFVPLLNIFLLLIISGISFGGYQYYQKAMHQNKDIARLENRLSQIQYDVPVEVNSKFDETFTFVNDLYYYDKAPSFKAVMKDVSEAMAEFMGLEIFKIDYSAKAAHLEIYGTITAPFDLAHKGYQQFLKIIKNKGYNIKESKFNTDIRESTFLLKLTRRIK